jgi:hypothetical protein
MKQTARLALALGVLLLPHSSVSAESTGPSSGKAKRSAPAHRKREGERAELFGGFSHTHSGSAGLNGWELCGALPSHGRFQPVVDFAHHSGSFAGADLSQSTLLVGAAHTWHSRALRPFARGLLGVVHSSTTGNGLSDSASHLALGGGGGATYPLSDQVGIRGQIDLLFSHGNGAWDTDPRLSIGLSYRFGG